MLRIEINDKRGGRMDADGSPKDLVEDMLQAINWLYFALENMGPGLGDYLRYILGAAVEDDECPCWTNKQDRQDMRIVLPIEKTGGKTDDN